LAEYIDALSKIGGIGSPVLTSANAQSGSVQFSIRAYVTKAALGGRYSTPNGGGR
jgi:hypothetical protein